MFATNSCVIIRVTRRKLNKKKALNKIEIFNKIHLIETPMIEIKIQRIVEFIFSIECVHTRVKE